VYKISHGWVDVLIFTSFYLEPDAISLWIRQRVCINFVQISEKVRRRPWEWLDEHSGKKVWAVYVKLKLAETERDETGEEGRQWHVYRFVRHRKFVLAHQTVNFTYYCDVLRRLCETVWRLRLELWQQKNCSCITITRRLSLPFSSWISSNKINMTIAPHWLYFSLFHDWR
jgi:hypothetical protein